MKITKTSDDLNIDIVITATLKGGSEFYFLAYLDLENLEKGWNLSFEINGQCECSSLNKGEKFEAVKLIKAIWERFSKYKCNCCGFTQHHQVCYKKLGFVVVDEFSMKYVPVE